MPTIVSTELKPGETSEIHRFQVAGLGIAPFHFTGEVTEKTYQACPGAPVQAGSSCDYCGTCIRYEFWVKSADGKEFKVGCDCIHKTGDRGLIQQISVAERKLRDKKNQAAKERKLAKLTARIEAAKLALPSAAGALSAQPHPSSWHTDKTLLDYVNWCFANGYGERAAITVERFLKGEGA